MNLLDNGIGDTLVSVVAANIQNERRPIPKYDGGSRKLGI
jgi:hypothetical protein